MCKSPESGRKWSMAGPYHIQPTIPDALVSPESSEQKAGVYVYMQALNGWMAWWRITLRERHGSHCGETCC